MKTIKVIASKKFQRKSGSGEIVVVFGISPECPAVSLKMFIDGALGVSVHEAVVKAKSEKSLLILASDVECDVSESAEVYNGAIVIFAERPLHKVAAGRARWSVSSYEKIPQPQCGCSAEELKIACKMAIEKALCRRRLVKE